VDDYIENLWKVHLKVAEEGYVQVKELWGQVGTRL
jgi:hypothetical protein